MYTQVEIPSTVRASIPGWPDLRLLSRTTGPCISIYLDSHTAALEHLQALLPEIEFTLAARGVDKIAIETLLAPIQHFHFTPGPSPASLVLFRSLDEMSAFQLPFATEQTWTVEGRFLLRPLWMMLRANRRFCVLAFSRGHDRLLECYGEQIRIRPMCEGIPNCPLVLAGSAAEVLSHSKVNTPPQTVAEAVFETPQQGLSDTDLAYFGRNLVNNWLSEKEMRALLRFKNANRDRISHKTIGILTAAALGGVQQLFVSTSCPAEYGDVDQICHHFVWRDDFRSSNDDLINRAIVETLRHDDGHVWLLPPQQMPEPVCMVAQLQY